MRTPLRLALTLVVMPASALFAPPAEAAPPMEDFSAEVASEEGAVYGRLRHVEGDPVMRRGDESFGELAINEPVAPGDVITTRSGRVELQLADGTILRLDRGTEMVLQSLPDSSGRYEMATILQLTSGALIVQAQGMGDAEKRFQIDTDDSAIFLLSDGVFRMDVEPGATTVISRRGAAEIMARDTSIMLRSGERVTVRYGEVPGEPRAVNTRAGDEFDAWSLSQDPEYVRQEDAVYPEPTDLPEPVRPYTTELSSYGVWQSYPNYGWAWRPLGVAPTWRPYVYGRWSWSPAGMIWVSYDPWGWAPYHYGRWEFAVGAGWLWIPGYTFSGAHVAWSVSPGYFGWCPLGYYNYPVHYGVSLGYHRSPWVYVRADHIYARRVNTVFVRDATVVKNIQREALVVRGQPRIHPHRASAGPAFTREMHRRFSARPDLQLDSQGERRPFRDQEQRSARRRANGRPDTVASAVPRPQQNPRANPTNSVPRPAPARAQRPTLFRSQAQRTPQETNSTPARSPRPIMRNQVIQRPASGPPPASPNSAPRRPSVIVQSEKGRQQSQQAQAPRQMRPGASTERVIPRIIPRQQPRTTRVVAPPSSGSAPRPAPGPRATAPGKQSGGNGKASSSTVRGQKGGGSGKGKKKS
ncbi:MAG: DUF6600 domain-containing protein [Candidatus Polarisedimenticolia bacterium]